MQSDKDILKQYLSIRIKNHNFIDWILKQQTDDMFPSDIVNIITLFIQYKNQNKLPIDKRDINQWTNIEELESYIRLLPPTKGDSKRQAKAAKTDNIIYKDDRYTVWYVNSHQQSRVLSQGAEWCISMNDFYFWKKYYYDNDNEFYFIRDNNYKLGKLLSMIAIVKDNNNIDCIFNYKDTNITKRYLLNETIKNTILNHKTIDLKQKIKNYFIECPEERYMLVRNNSLWGVIDKFGAMIVPIEFNKVEFFDKCIQVIKDKKYGAYNYSGKLILPVEYKWMTPQNYFMSIKVKEYKNGLADYEGNIVLPCIYEWVLVNNNNVRVKLKDKEPITMTNLVKI